MRFPSPPAATRMTMRMLQRLTARRCASRLTLAALAMVALPAMTRAQGTPLSISDLLDIRTVSIGDLSDDGQWLFATTARPATSLGVDYNRSFGDPTYALSLIHI